MLTCDSSQEFLCKFTEYLISCIHIDIVGRATDVHFSERLSHSKVINHD